VDHHRTCQQAKQAESMEAAAQLQAQRESVAAAKAAVREAPSTHARQSAQAKLAELEAVAGRSQRTLQELERQTDEAEAKLTLRTDAEAKWLEALKKAEGAEKLCPIFPVGDALVEPFWPQGLGSNRGFHSALDAAWAIHVMHAEGSVEPALVDRAFCYDVMLHGAFVSGSVLPGGNWTADCLTRYAPSLVKGTLMTYEDPHSKRSHKGRAAVPSRYLSLVGASLAVIGKAPARM